MKIIDINLRRLSRYTLTSFLREVEPVLILYKGNMVRVISFNTPTTFREDSYKERKTMAISGWQVANFEEKGGNYYVAGWNK